MINSKINKITERVALVATKLRSGLSPEEAAKELDAISADLTFENERIAGLESMATATNPEPGREAAQGV